MELTEGGLYKKERFQPWGFEYENFGDLDRWLIVVGGLLWDWVVTN